MASQPATPTTPNTPRTASTPRTPGFNTKSPTIKRILSESRELASHPDPALHAAPLDNNLFEWHFTIAGPPSSPYESGIYHGRIILPPSYPLRPPAFRFLTPSGRFETNREICLSISGHHEETWQPAWGIRTALCAIRAFMAGEAKGQIGGLDMQPEARARLARESRSWRCGTGCESGKTNEEVLRECEEAWKAAHVGEDSNARPEMTKVPEELRLAYKDDLERGPPTPGVAAESASVPTDAATDPQSNRTETVGFRQRTPVSPSPLRAGPVANLLARAKPPPSPLRATSSASDKPSTLHPASGPHFQTPCTTPLNTASHASSPIPATPNIVPPTPTTAGIGDGGLMHRRRRPAASPAATPTVTAEAIPAWVDKLIVGLVVGLVVMVIKKVIV